MSDDLNKKGKPDRNRINVYGDHNERYWTNELGISEARLNDLVLKHGPMANDLRKVLGKD